MIALYLNLQWWWQVAIPLGIVIWVLIGFSIFEGSIKYGHKDRWFAGIIYGIFGGLLSSAGIMGVLILFGFLFGTDGGNRPIPPQTRSKSKVIVKTQTDTIYVKEEPKEENSTPGWLR